MAECEKVENLESDGGSPGDCGAGGLIVQRTYRLVSLNPELVRPSVEAEPVNARIQSPAGRRIRVRGVVRP